jgi:carbamoyl-phosphate synthase large subunit
VVRPSYVLGGRAMEVVYGEEDLRRYMREAVQVSNESPVLLDHFLDNAVELDVDAICDGKEVLIGGVMEHIEQAGVHSGDSACSLPPYTLSAEVQEQLRDQVRKMARELKVVGLMNTQFAIQGGVIYVIEVNPRASRTVPFVSKACGQPLAKIAARCMVGKSLAEQGITHEVVPSYYSVKEAVFPFIKFPGVDPLLGPEMKSTGEVMGVGATFAEAFAKAQLAAGVVLPRGGKAFVSVRDADKGRVAVMAQLLVERGFELYATQGTAQVLEAAGVACQRINKVTEGRPHIVDMIKNNEVSLIINTAEGKQAIKDSYAIRRAALLHKVSYTTTMAGAEATSLALQYLDAEEVRSLQQLHKEIA